MLCKNLSHFPERKHSKVNELFWMEDGQEKLLVSKDHSPLVQHASIDVKDDASAEDQGSSDLLARRPERR